MCTRVIVAHREAIFHASRRLAGSAKVINVNVGRLLAFFACTDRPAMRVARHAFERGRPKTDRRRVQQPSMPPLLRLPRAPFMRKTLETSPGIDGAAIYISLCIGPSHTVHRPYARPEYLDFFYVNYL
jgi:hypothetical protein